MSFDATSRNSSLKTATFSELTGAVHSAVFLYMKLTLNQMGRYLHVSSWEAVFAILIFCLLT